MTRIRAGLHNHCTLCDGRNSPREMVEAAIGAGFTDFGFSSHGYTAFDTSYCLKDEAVYRDTIRTLAQEYARHIRVYCGVEQDFDAPLADRQAYDYVIGSCHYLWGPEGRYYPVDGSPEKVEACRDEAFGGDVRKMVEAYYARVAQGCETCRPDIAGHIDVIGRNNRGMRFFDENATWYLDAAFAAIQRIVDAGIVFELNTNGWPKRGECYPAPPLLRRICQIGGRMTVNADAHSVQNVALHFEDALERLRAAGFREVQVWEDGQFRPMGL